MANEHTKVIAYVGDNSDVLKKIEQIQNAEKRMVAGFGTDFGQVARTIGHDLERIRKKVPEIINPKTGEQAIRQFETVSQTVELTDGRIGKLSETTEVLNGKLVSTSYGFNQLNKGLSESEKVQAALMGKSSQLATNLGNVTDVNTKFAKELTNVGQASYLIGKNFTKISGDTQTFGTLVATSNGKILQLNETIRRTPEGIQNVGRSVTDLTTKYNVNKQAVSDLNKNTVGLGENIMRLAKRAALTIPLWLVLRGAVMGTLSAIGNSVDNIFAFDKAMQKVKQNLSGSTTSIASNMQSLRKEILQTSLELGVSTESIAEAIKKFASLGFSFEDSLAGGIGATKLATVLFGDAAETADSFARAMNLLIDRSAGAASAQQQMNEMYALAAKLEKTNQFEIKEVNDSLKNFAGTAKSFNLTGKQTLAILATLGTSLLEGARGGTAASTAFQQMASHLPDVSKFLNLGVDVKNMPILDAFVLIIEAIEKLNKTDTIAATEAINKLFGGLKAAKPIRALIADLGKLRENLQMTAPLSEFEGRVKDVTNTLFKQAEIFHNLNKEIGKAFLTGIIGGDDFVDTMTIINKSLKGIQENSRGTGESIRKLSQAMVKLPLAIAESGALVGVGKTIAEMFTPDPNLSNKIYKQFFDVAKLAQQGFIKGLDKNAISDALSKIGLLKSTALKNPKLVDDNFLSNLKIVEDTFKKMESTTASIAENTEKTKDSISATARPEAERQELAEVLLKSEIEKLKVIGASNSAILQAEKDYVRILNISQEEKDVLERKLEIERAINDERKLQSKLGSDSVRLFKITQESGVDVARQIGEVLSGQMDFETFVRRGGSALDVFKKQFEDLFEQQQATAFFKGNVVPGATGLRGGYGIPIEEEAIRRPYDTASIRAAASRANLLPSRTDTVVAPAIPVNINANIDISKLQEVKDQFVKEVTKQLPKAGTDLNNALVQALTGKQGTNI